MTVFGDTNDMPNEIRKLHKEINLIRDQAEFQPILTTGRSDDGFGASVGSKTMNSQGVWSLTPVIHTVNKLTTGATLYDMIELISACAVIDKNPLQGASVTELDVKTIRMGSINEAGVTVNNSAPNGTILFIKPINGKKITLKAGGNIHISKDVTLDDKAFAILQFYVTASMVVTPPVDGSNPFPEENKMWVLLTGGGGTSVNAIKEPCRCATTGNNISPLAIGSTVDGTTIVVDDRVLYKNQTDAEDNGIYVCTNINGIVATMKRATDFDDDSEVKAGTIVTVNEGTSNGNKLFMMTEDVDIIVGTTDINFTLVTAVDTALDYVWTGQHKFQGDPTGAIGDVGATHTVEFGNTGSDRVRFIGEITGIGDAVITDPDGSGTYTIPNSDPSVSMKASVVMNTYTMYDLDTLVFSQAESTQTPAPLNNWVWIEADTGTGSSPVLTGMKYNVPSGKTHQFAVDGTNVVTIDSTGIVGGMGVQLDADPTWTGKHVWDNATTWSEDYDTDSEKATNCHVKFQGDGQEHANYDYTDASANPTQRVLEIGKYGTHEVKIIAEVTGEGDAIITDPDGSGTYTIPNSDPSISFKASLVMNTYTMYDLDTLVFSQGASTTTPPPLDNWVYIEANTGTSGSPSLTGMHYNVPTSKTHQFKVNGTEKLNISSDGIKLSGNSTPSSLTNGMMWLNSTDNKVYARSNGATVELGSGGGSTSFIGFTADDDLEMNTFDITGVDSLKFSTASNSGDTVGNSEYGIEIEGAPSSPSRLRFNVPSGKSFSFQVNGSIVASIGDDGKGTFDGGVNIGNDADGLMLNNSSGDPSVNGHFRTNGTDVKVYSGGAVRNMSDIGSGGSSDNLGNHTATTTLNMNGQDISGLDDIAFNVTGQSISSDSSNLYMNVPSGDGIQFWSNGSATMSLASNNIIYVYDPFSMGNNKITNLGTPTSDYDASTKKYVDDNAGSSGANTSLNNLSANGESHFDDRYLNDSGSQTKSGATTFTGTTSMNATVNLGNSSADNINLKGKLDVINNTTVSQILYSSMYTSGYISIEVDGVAKRLYYSAG
jgi:hypothetical protein